MSKDHQPSKEELDELESRLPDSFYSVIKAALQPTKEWKEKQEKKGH